jgi:hypothetical protein
VTAFAAEPTDNQYLGRITTATGKKILGPDQKISILRN